MTKVSGERVNGQVREKRRSPPARTLRLHSNTPAFNLSLVSQNEEKQLRPGTTNVPADLRGDSMLAVTRAAVRIQDLAKTISAIEGGIRTLGPGADQASVRRIREAVRSLASARRDLLADFAVILALISYGQETDVPKGKTLASHFLDRLTQGGSAPRRKSISPTPAHGFPLVAQETSEKKAVDS